MYWFIALAAIVIAAAIVAVVRRQRQRRPLRGSSVAAARYWRAGVLVGPGVGYTREQLDKFEAALARLIDSALTHGARRRKNSFPVQIELRTESGWSECFFEAARQADIEDIALRHHTVTLVTEDTFEETWPHRQQLYPEAA